MTGGDGQPASGTAQTAAGLAEAVMARLASSRPVFHTEADFQHAFAWEGHQLYPDAQVRLERRLSVDTNERLDLLLCFQGIAVAVELKYPVAKLDAVLEGEPFVLRAQGAEDHDKGRASRRTGARSTRHRSSDAGATACATGER